MSHSMAWEAVPRAETPSVQSGARRQPRLHSLQTRLILSHAFVLVLALLLVLALSAAYLRRYEQQAAVERLSDLAVPLAVEAGSLAHPPTTAAAVHPSAKELLRMQAREMGARILVFSPQGIVLYDTKVAPNLDGQTLTAFAKSIKAVHAAAVKGGGVHRAQAKPSGAAADPFGNQILVVAAGSKELHSTPQIVFGIVAPRHGLPLLSRYLPRLLIAAAIALMIALLAGYLLSLRIAAPIRRLTVAADAMTAGNLEQRVPGEDTDEIGRLVASFNTMSARVAVMTRSQRELLANIAHELRTPLTSVQGYTQALRDRIISDPSDQDDALATIGGEAERMGRLIGQLLDLARLEAGQTTLASGPVDVQHVFGAVKRRFEPEADRRSVALRAEALPGLLIQGDEERLLQVLGNLTSNALRFTPAGGQIVLGAMPVAMAGDRASGIRLTVRDTGQGIAADRLPRIFDRFERGEADGSGFGLGLAIARELVQAQDGAIAVASQLGQGTTFTIDLPAAADPAPVPSIA